jgi:diguanylate cyclase (GGDEF)-like protein
MISEERRKCLMINVFIAKGPEQGRSFVLSDRTADIGRGAANQVRLNEPSVSRNHAKVYWENGQYYIEDLQSRNGTWINGNAIESGVRVQVQEGVPVAFGNVLVSFGKKCAPNRLPNQYSISVQRPGDDGLKPSTFADRRAKQKKELELIHDISIELLGSLDLTELCGKALDSITGLLKRIDSGFLFLFDPSSGKLSKIASRFKKRTAADAPRYSRSLVRRAVKEGRAVMMLDTATENKANLSDSMENIGVKSVICVPLVGKMGTRGAIYFQSVNVAHGFRKDDLLFLNSLSIPIALAIENALLYARSKRAEERLQKASNDLEQQVMNRTSALKKAKDKLGKLSITDGLSGLYNYRYLIHSLDSELRRAIRYHRTLALLLIDIDYLKDLNDTYGHRCGDYVIKTLGKILKGNVRATDVVARYGGDELAVMLIETNAKSALEIAEKLKKEIGSHLFKWQTKQLSVSVSIGLAMAPAPGIQGVSHLIEATDRALYQAKRAGRNSVGVFGQKDKSALINLEEHRLHHISTVIR